MLEDTKSKRTATGGLRSTLRRRDKRLCGLANAASETALNSDKERRVVYRGKGANTKTKLYLANKVSLSLEGKTVNADLITVSKNTSNKEYVRRNVITKGAEVKVKYNDKEYMAKVTSKPGQSGTIHAVAL